jgi:hypothetical protein
MKRHGLVRWLLLGVVLTASPEVFAQSNIRQLNVDGIVKAIGKEGNLTGEMYKVSFPRSDLTVKAGNVMIKPALALVNWAAFIKSDNTAAITYGDLVLLDDEINPAISKLEDNGIELSALHNHLLHENPRVMYIHFVGRGDEVEMAKGVREALAVTKTPLYPITSGPEAKPDLATLATRAVWPEVYSTSTYRATIFM